MRLNLSTASILAGAIVGPALATAASPLASGPGPAEVVPSSSDFDSASPSLSASVTSSGSLTSFTPTTTASVSTHHSHSIKTWTVWTTVLSTSEVDTTDEPTSTVSASSVVLSSVIPTSTVAITSGLTSHSVSVTSYTAAPSSAAWSTHSGPASSAISSASLASPSLSTKFSSAVSSVASSTVSSVASSAVSSVASSAVASVTPYSSWHSSAPSYTATPYSHSSFHSSAVPPPSASYSFSTGSAVPSSAAPTTTQTAVTVTKFVTVGTSPSAKPSSTSVFTPAPGASVIPNLSAMKFIQTDDAAVPAGPGSQAIVSGDHLYIAGYLPLSPNTGKLVGDGDVVGQTFATLANIRNIIEFSGSSMDKVVKLTLYLENMSDLSAVSRVISRVFRDHRPVMSVVAVKDLPKNALIEMDAMVRMP